MTYSISWEPRGVYLAYQGKVSFADFLGAVLAIHADSNYASIKYVIHDMLQATELDFAGLDMTAMVAHELGARFTNPGVRPAVVSGNPDMQAVTRAFSELTGLAVGFFDTVTAARAWANAVPAAAAAIPSR